MTTAIAPTAEQIKEAYAAAWHHMTKGKVYTDLDDANKANAGKYLCSLFYGPQPEQQPVSDEVATEMQRRFTMSCVRHNLTGLNAQREPWYAARETDARSYLDKLAKGKNKSA